MRKIMVFLHGHSVSTSKAVRIYKTYGEQAIDVVSHNPYRLAEDIRGIGFKSADTIAQNVGIAKDSILRARAGVSYTLNEASGNHGHCFLPRGELIREANALLDIPEATIDAAIDQEVARVVISEVSTPLKNAVYLSSLLAAEQGVATQLHALQT